MQQYEQAEKLVQSQPKASHEQITRNRKVSSRKGPAISL
jgi:hypothetical protein